MACFVVPVGEAIITSVVQKVISTREKKSGNVKSSGTGLTWSRRLGWLNNMLWGGAILLAFEHIWHGEVVPWPPFLTAMENPADVSPMLHEMATFGTAMAVCVTVIWGIMILIVEQKAKSRLAVKAAPAGGGGE